MTSRQVVYEDFQFSFLGCVCFRWKWFPKMLFCKCGCLVAHGKYIFWKCFSVWPCVGCKIIFVFILPSNLIFRKTERERERERERVRVRSRSCAKRERERGRRESHRRRPRAFDFVDDLEPSRHEPMNPQTNLRLRRWTQSPDHP